MAQYPILLLPKGEIMITAKVEGDEVKYLKKTLFPSKARYTISGQGLTACLDMEKKLILYGQLNLDGDFEYLKILPFPSMICPKSISIIKNNIMLGGDNNMFQEEIKSHELIVSYSITHDKFTKVDMPYEGPEKSVDDFLVENNKLIAVDDFVLPKYLIEYDVSNPDYPHLVASYSLPQNGTYERIRKGSFNKEYMALLSTTFGMEEGRGEYINIFHKGNYKSYIRLSLLHGLKTDLLECGKKTYWRDIYLIPDMGILLISAGDDGLGVYRIDNDKMGEDDNEDSQSVIYYNSWDRIVIKVLPIPNDENILIILMQKDREDNLVYSYAIESIENIRTNYNLNYRKNDLEDNGEYEEEYEDDSEDDYDHSYGRYSGSWAKDVEGLSDDFIDDVLDGEPDAYWNID